VPVAPVKGLQETSDLIFPQTDRIHKNPDQQAARSTQRIRRGTSGSFTQDIDYTDPSTDSVANPHNPGTEVITSVAMQVICAHCQNAFAVQRKTQEYNAVCIHCGGLNRILPA
jgi:hypothetical protein